MIKRWEKIRNYLAAIAFVAGLGVLTVFVLQLNTELSQLKSAPTDNVQWAMAQIQVEMLVLKDAIQQTSKDPSSSNLAEIRRRFDVFYSRISTIQNGQIFSDIIKETSIQEKLLRVTQTLDANIPLIDGPDAELQMQLPILEAQISDLQSVVRQLSLDGVTIFARSSDRDRESFSTVLIKTAIIALVFVVAMLIALGMLIHQHRLSRRRAEQLQISNLRYATAIRASLDPIVVTDDGGHILDFNPAAERTFGYTREGALGAIMDDLIIPEEFRTQFRHTLSQYLDGKGDATESSRIEIQAVRAGDSRFDAEFSFGASRGIDHPIVTIYIRDISSRLRYEAALTTARDEALAAAKAKSSFLAVMSHEMRTPLNGVMGILDLIKDTKLTSVQRGYIETAITSGEILQRHVDDVLDITRIEAGAAQLKPVNFGIQELLQEIQNINGPAAQNKGNTLTVMTVPGLRSVVQDRHRLRQVLMNMVGNAIKFTTNGHVSLTATTVKRPGKQHWVRFSVADTGIGIDTGDLERIFDDFVMLDPSYKRTSQGSGLGLGISRRLVRMMGGEIGVESTPQKGSTFWFDIPVLETTSAPTTPGRAAGKESKRDLKYGLSVLLVEDNDVNRLVASEMLRRRGCKVVEAVDGVEGHLRAKEQIYDLILMDVSMPNLDGIAATRLIRAEGGASKDSVIVGLTAHAMPEERRNLKEAGMQDCLIKPLRLHDLDQMLERIASGGLASFDPQPAATATASIDELFDRGVLQELAETLPEDIIKRQTERFLRTLEEAEINFQQEVQALQDAGALARLAHRHAGAAAIFGATLLRDALSDLEETALAGEKSRLPNLCQRVSSLSYRTRNALPNLIEQLFQQDADTN
ncbi:ATP-binding protein [Agrobacterium salinitolerans]